MKQASAVLIFCFFAASFVPAHAPGEDMATINLGKGKVTIQYGTPKLGNRNLDQMITPGLAWRMGMNNPTTLETTVALDFGAAKKLPPGKYTIFARPDEKKNWTLLVASGMQEMFSPRNLVVEAPLHFMKVQQAPPPPKE